MCSGVQSGWSSRLDRKNGDPLPAARSASAIARSTSPGSQTSMKWIGNCHTSGESSPPSIPVAWLTGEPTRFGRSVGGHARSISLIRTSASAERCECTTPFGFAVVPEVYPTKAGASGSTCAGWSSGSLRRRSVNRRCPPSSSPTTTTSRSAGALAVAVFKHLEVVVATEAIGADVDLRARLQQDELHFLGAVEVDDRHDHRAEHRQAPERGRGLDPVRQLQRDDVARLDAQGPEPGGGAERHLVGVADGAPPRPDARPDAELEVRRSRERRSWMYSPNPSSTQ